MAEGLEAAKPVIRALCEAQAKLIGECGKPVGDFPFFPDYTEEQLEAVTESIGDRLQPVLGIVAKAERDEALNDLTASVVEELAERFPEEEGMLAAAVNAAFKKTMRHHVLTEGVRMDGRTPVEIRTITAEAGVLPRVHGSALFQRGETQILGVTTLNMLKMEQQLDNLSPATHRRYIHHYNFPPYSTGETGRVGSPKRREIGHGHLAEIALESQLPSREEFPYAIRQVSETMGSNGSSSMGSVCASTLSLYNAGVPLKAPVAGIAMGLVSDTIDGETKYCTLTDILAPRTPWATWTSRWPAPANTSRPSSSTRSSTASPRRSSTPRSPRPATPASRSSTSSPRRSTAPTSSPRPLRASSP